MITRNSKIYSMWVDRWKDRLPRQIDNDIYIDRQIDRLIDGQVVLVGLPWVPKQIDSEIP